MAKPGTVIGWKLDRSQRKKLLDRFPPRYANPDADHVTLRTDAAHAPLPPRVKALIVGHADDGDSLEAMVVELDGATDRPDGSTFHITWSLDKSKGRKPRESNDLLRNVQWAAFDHPVPILIEPARF